jgi:hypothetical protein
MLESCKCGKRELEKALLFYVAAKLTYGFLSSADSPNFLSYYLLYANSLTLSLPLIIFIYFFLLGKIVGIIRKMPVKL